MKNHTKNMVENSTSLIKKGKLFLFEDVNDKSAAKLYKQLCWVEQLNIPVELTICSSGGDVECACAIIDKIQEISKKVAFTTVVTGKAYSAAALILMASINRFAYPNASIMFHPCHYRLSDYHDHNRAYVEFTEATYPKLMRLVTEQAKMGKRQARAFIDKSKIGVWLTAQEAVSLKIINGIVE